MTTELLQQYITPQAVSTTSVTSPSEPSFRIPPLLNEERISLLSTAGLAVMTTAALSPLYFDETIAEDKAKFLVEGHRRRYVSTKNFQVWHITLLPVA